MNLPSKYRNQPTEVDNIRFASKREAKRYQDLRLLERAALIQNLQLQVRFPLVVYNTLICTYVADFVYINKDQQVVEDCKGHRTREYIIKRKLMKAVHGIDILET